MTEETLPVKTERADTRKTMEVEIIESIEVAASKEVQTSETLGVAKESKISVAMETIRKVETEEAIEGVASVRETVA